MQSRLFLLSIAALALACTSSGKDDSAGTDPASTGSSTSAGSAGTSGGSSAGTMTLGSTTSEEPTTGGPSTSPGTSSTESAEAGESSSTLPGTETGSAEVSFTAVYEQVLLPNGCTAGYCHGMGAGGLELTDEATSYANLVEVNAAAAVCGQSMRVVPGSLEESILWYRVRPAALDDVPACASKMPQGSMGLSEADAQLVNDWIAGGALE